MQLSYYLKSYPINNKDNILLFSTKRASKVLISESTFQDIKSGIISKDNEKLLKKLGMIVPDIEEEKKFVLNAIERSNQESETLVLTVVLNMDCNLACIYCFEDGQKGKYYMQDSTATLLVKFIKDKLSNNKKRIIIDFYGGEPLLSLGLIKYISSSIKKETDKKNAEYSFTLVTNGTLFTKKIAKSLLPYGLKSIKVTLDGPGETHDHYRPFISGKGSFDKIIKNLKDTGDLVKLNVGGNYDRNSFKKFTHLLDYLESVGLTPNKLNYVKFDPIISKPDDDVSPVDYHDGCISVDEPWLKKAEKYLRKQILSKGYKTGKPGPMACMVEIKNALVVNYDGKLYKCPAFTGREEYSIGDLQTGTKAYSDIYNIGNYKNEKCINCVYLPLCFGGCRFMSFLQHGDIEHLDCREKYFDDMLEMQVVNLTHS